MHWLFQGCNLQGHKEQDVLYKLYRMGMKHTEMYHTSTHAKLTKTKVYIFRYLCINNKLLNSFH